MHEIHQVQKLVNDAMQLSRERKLKQVKEVAILVGEMLGFDEGSIRLYWEDMTAGTALAGARLAIQIVPAKLQCPQCGQNFEKRKSDLDCPQCKCLGKPTPSGKEFCIKDIIV